MKKSWIIISIVVVVVALATLIITRNKHEELGLTRVTIGYIPIVADLHVFVAIEEGYFKDEGLDVDLVEFGSSNDAMNALMAGRIAMEGCIGTSSLYSVQQKSPGEFKIILSEEQTEEKFGGYIIVRKDSPIQSINDLKGKKVGTYTGLTHLLNVKMILKHFMDPEKDVEFIQVSPRLQIQALEARQFDALFSIEPYPTIATERGIARVLVENPRTKYIHMPFPVCATPVATGFIKENPNATKALISALNRAVEFIRTNEEEARNLLTKYTPLTKNVAKKCNMYEWRILGEEDRKAHQSIADLFFKAGLLEGRINTDNIFLTESDLE